MYLDYPVNVFPPQFNYLAKEIKFEPATFPLVINDPLIRRAGFAGTPQQVTDPHVLPAAHARKNFYDR
jgi:hypothetical protein